MWDVPENPIGLSKFAGWDDMCRGKPLLHQLEAAGIPYETVDIPHLVGMAGCARLVFYTSVATGKPITTLLVPLRGDIDSFGEEYYIWIGMTREQALESESRWLDWYAEAREIVKRARRPQPKP